METFNLLDNKLIDIIDSESKTRSLDAPMINSLKTLIKAHESVIYTSGEIYNRKKSILVPNEYDDLSQLYLKVTVGNGFQATDIESDFATKIFKYEIGRASCRERV